jgi:hypothetical protein
MPYSAVSQPRPRPSNQGGTPATSEAVQITRVAPIEISAEPSAVRTNPGSISTSRSWSTARPSGLRAAALTAVVSSELSMAGCYCRDR